MNKILKITLNILLFLLVVGFGVYMIHSIMLEDKIEFSDNDSGESQFVSPYTKSMSFEAASPILCFDIYGQNIFAAQSTKVSVFDLSGKPLYYFSIEPHVRDMVVDSAAVWLLYPTRIEVYSVTGQKSTEWEACSEQSDYCAFTTTKEFVFVTDAENKNIVQYDKQGRLVRFIKSPQGFIIPSYAFDIISIHDTLYCANSGRHQIESYTLDGTFISSFGKAGTEADAFVGCCNPVYLAKSTDGHILTSEKGTPRISSWSRAGTFREVLLTVKSLGGGTAAYKVRVSGENLYIADKKTISVYSKGRACPAPTDTTCAGCNATCPL